MILSAHDAELAMRLLIATVLGAVVGLERGIHGKDAGFKTYTLVCLGSALMMVLSTEIFLIYKGIATVDPSRIAAQVVTGIGFLGAGAIIRSQRGSVRGLTTAAGIWTICGIGMACGVGLYKIAIITTILVLVILILFLKVERLMVPKKNQDE
jgi:putative Mg2+ transporter-C (MgtC) family protein